MGQLSIPQPSKLIIGLIYHSSIIKDKALVSLKKKFGAIDFLSPEIDFNYTDYYYAELGRPLRRFFMSFEKLVQEDALAKVKLYTNTLEERYSQRGKRHINIDPGLLNLGKLIMATTKDYNHRIYIGKGIYAEVTLYFRNNSFIPWQWTYPDYQSREYSAIFNTIRSLYAKQLKCIQGISPRIKTAALS